MPPVAARGPSTLVRWSLPHPECSPLSLHPALPPGAKAAGEACQASCQARSSWDAGDGCSGWDPVARPPGSASSHQDPEGEGSPIQDRGGCPGHCPSSVSEALTQEKGVGPSSSVALSTGPACPPGGPAAPQDPHSLPTLLAPYTGSGASHTPGRLTRQRLHDHGRASPAEGRLVGRHVQVRGEAEGRCRRCSPGSSLEVAGGTDGRPRGLWSPGIRQGPGALAGDGFPI